MLPKSPFPRRFRRCSQHIDRLPADAKSILNAAAVIGTNFDMEVLHTLLGEAVPSGLADLVSAGSI